MLWIPPGFAHGFLTLSDGAGAIVQHRCAVCHRPGEAGPFALLTHADVAGRTAVLRQVIEEGRMPPWGAAGPVGMFQDDRRLVMPLGFSLPLGALFFAAFWGVFGVRLAEPLFVGLTPGFVGLYQINVRVPEGVPTLDDFDLSIEYNNQPSNRVKIATQR